MPDLMDRLERVAKRHVLKSVPTEGLAHLRGLTLADLLIEYRVLRGRFVAPMPRKVHVSRELRSSPEANLHRPVLDELIRKIEHGIDMTPHLSRRIVHPYRTIKPTKPSRRSDRDLLLSDWGIHHLHLSLNLQPDGMTERSRDVLFAVFDGDNAYLIGIFAHPNEANWATEDIFAVMVRNWPNAGLVHQAHGVIGLSQHYSDEDRLKLRNAGISNLMEIDGKVFMPGRLGQTAAGTPMQATREVNALMWQISVWRENTQARLDRTEGIPPGAYWSAAIHKALSGFEEYCGFAAARTFIPVGRLC
jgi:hypothetical protein